MAAGPIPGDVRQGLYLRCGGYCDWCGHVLTSFDAHHRLLRSRGGKNTLDNLVAVCSYPCHHDSIHAYPAIATERGFMVPAGHDPADIPLVFPGGYVVILTRDGGVIEYTGDSTSRKGEATP